ncbi:hypothetical protein [Sphingosinicella terrae]|uniref:hypothetical protein n=1 Tax=Sphingosinicella terrae TaxID=2172047 RepID=UPI000E0DBA06|nr:hypothetical protein [Sphingosinicella terrae]
MDMTAEELARLRSIAEEGRHAPLLGGWHLILWGVAMTIALLVNWAVLERHLNWPGYSLSISWFGLVILAWIGSALIQVRQEGRPGALSVGNRVARTVWLFAGGFLTVLSVGLFARGMLVGGAEAWQLYAMMPPIGFGVYAIAISASGMAADDSGARLYAWMSLVFAAITAMLIGEGALYPATAAGVLLISIGWGTHQLRSARHAR